MSSKRVRGSDVVAAIERLERKVEALTANMDMLARLVARSGNDFTSINLAQAQAALGTDKEEEEVAESQPSFMQRWHQVWGPGWVPPDKDAV